MQATISRPRRGSLARDPVAGGVSRLGPSNPAVAARLARAANSAPGSHAHGAGRPALAVARLLSMSVSRETVEATIRRFDLPDAASTTDAVEALLAALAAEADPPTTVRDPAEALDLHIADSLAGLELLELRAARRIADLGAGAGFPGL